jgi:peptidase S41-like protein
MGRLRTAVFSILAIASAGSSAEQLPERSIDAATRSQVITAVLEVVEKRYVFPEVASKMVESIRAHERTGDYSQVTSAYHLATTLTQDLQSISKDKHLRVVYTAIEVGAGHGTPTAEETAKIRDAWRKINYGFERVERLDNNIGYLDMRVFLPPGKEASETVAAAMTFLANSDALIIDMRRNGGGHPAMIALLSSYLFDERTHLNSLYWREGDRLEEFWTTQDVGGRKFGQSKPIFVLTSGSTFSGAEEFCYNLQTRKRAVIVGETTRGGAHPGGQWQVHEYFAVWVPAGRAINPITNTNWEGTGVKPDVEVPASDALEAAKRLANEAIRKPL